MRTGGAGYFELSVFDVSRMRTVTNMDMETTTVENGAGNGAEAHTQPHAQYVFEDGKLSKYLFNGGNVLQQLYYHPFGGVWGDAGTNIGLQPWKYSGKEYDHRDGLDLYDYGARLYDPAGSRWTSPDPLCEKYYNISPYTFCNNNPINNIDPDGRAVFWLKGKVIGNDGIDDNRVLVVRTEGKNKKNAVKKFIKLNSGNSSAFTEGCIAYAGSVAIESSAKNRQAMVDIVGKDDGKGGSSDANNREYGGSIQEGKVVEATPGKVRKLGEPDAHMRLPGGYSTFHSHPSGRPGGEVVSANTVNFGETGGEVLKQSPSQPDMDVAGNNIHYVFGRKDGYVYVYDKNGIITSFPTEYFVTPKIEKK